MIVGGCLRKGLLDCVVFFYGKQAGLRSAPVVCARVLGRCFGGSFGGSVRHVSMSSLVVGALSLSLLQPISSNLNLVEDLILSLEAFPVLFVLALLRSSEKLSLDCSLMQVV